MCFDMAHTPTCVMILALSSLLYSGHLEDGANVVIIFMKKKKTGTVFHTLPIKHLLDMYVIQILISPPPHHHPAVNHL